MGTRSARCGVDPRHAPTPASLRSARVGVAVTFLVTGALFATWAARIPAIKQQLGLSDGQLAVALMALNAGAVAGLQLGGVLVPRLGSRPALRLALPAYAVALLGPGLAVNLATLGAGLFALAVANSVVDVAMNAHGIVVERRYRRPVLSSLHAMFSLGGIIGGALGALAASLDVGVAAHFLAVALATTGAGLVATRRLLPARVDAAGPTARPAGTSGWLHGWSGRVIGLGVLGFSLCLAEGSANDWAAVYLRDTLGTSAGTAAAGVMVFMAAMTVGRLAGDRLAGRLGTVAAFKAGTALAGGGFAAALVADRPVAGLAGLALLGGGLSFTLPLVLSAAGRLPGEPAAAAVARASTLSYLGAFAGPGAIGALAGIVGLAAALGMVALVVAATALGARAVAAAAPTTAGPLPGGFGGGECGCEWCERGAQ
jgi:fucose permease